MIKYLKEYRFYIALFSFLLIPILAIDTATRNPRDFRTPDRVIIALTGPLQALITGSLDLLSEFFERYIFLFHTQEQNTQLLEQNRKLQGQIALLRESKEENERLKKILKFQEQYEIKTSIARVIARDVTSEFKSVRINRGSEDGIRKNMAVLTHDGAVGRVLRVTAHTADIVTLVDFQSSVDVVVERSRARGIVAGLTDQLCELKYALRTDDIQVGDLLVSSGLGGIFPKGIPVGTVSRVNKKSYGINQEVEVRPSVELTKLEEVMVVTQGEYDRYFSEAPLSNQNGGTVGGKKP